MVIVGVGIGILVYGHHVVTLLEVSLFNLVHFFFLIFYLPLWLLLLLSVWGFCTFVTTWWAHFEASFPIRGAHSKGPLADLTRRPRISLLRPIKLNQIFLTQGRFWLSIFLTLTNFCQVVLNDSLIILHFFYSFLKYLHFIVQRLFISVLKP